MEPRVALALFFLALAVASWGYWLFAWWCTRSFFRTRQKLPGDFAPPVSILKPLRGLDLEARQNFLSFVRQDYPRFEILFGALEPDDPNIPLVRELRGEFPGVDIRLVLAQPLGTNPKVSILHSLASRASHPLLAVSDSDMRVESDYLRRVVAPLADPQVGLVTCAYRGGGKAGNLPARLEVLYFGATFLPSVLVGRRYLAMRFGLGATLVVRREDLARFGGFPAVADYLADDRELAVRIVALGKRVHLSDYIPETMPGGGTMGTLAQLWHRQVRWAKCIRVSQGWEYLGYLVTFSLPLSLAVLVLAGFSGWGMGVVAASLALRWMVAWLVSGETGNRGLRRHLVWLPLGDLFWFSSWCAAALGRKIVWRGQAYRLGPGGVLEERIFPPSSAANTQKRAGDQD